MKTNQGAIAALTLPFFATPAANVAAEAPAPADRTGPVSHFASGENPVRIDHELLEAAGKSVELAAYNLSHHTVVQALCRLAQAGVRVYLDGGAAGEHGPPGPAYVSPYRLAREASAEIRVKQAPGLMLLKAYLIDSQVLRTGSSNLSPSGRKDNDVIVIGDADAVACFAMTFERLRARSGNKVWKAER